MWNYFFGGSTKKKNSVKETIIEQRSHLEMLKRKENNLEEQIEGQVKSAKRYLNANDKKSATNALRRKKQLEGQLEKLQGSIIALEAQVNAIESANLNNETLKMMQQGSKAMKQIHNGMDIDKVDSTMDDIREQMQIADEVSEAISRPVGNDVVDEDELEQELEQMQQEQLDAKMINAGNVPAGKLPEVPVSSIKHNPLAFKDKEAEEVEDEDEEEELRKLQEEMAM